MRGAKAQYKVEKLSINNREYSCPSFDADHISLDAQPAMSLNSTAMSQLGQSLPIHSAPVPTNVGYTPNSDRFEQGSET